MVSSLLIAKVTTGTPGAEPLRLGFSGGSAESATGSGSVEGATSIEADATIVIVGRVGDIDGDGDVDLLDFVTFAVCITSPGVTTPPDGCTAAEFAASDLDGDLDVDLIDFVTFAANFGT